MGAAGGVGQHQVNISVKLHPRVINDGNRETPRRLAGKKGQLALDRSVIDPGSSTRCSRGIAAKVIDRNRPDRAVGANNRDRRLKRIFISRVLDRTEIEYAMVDVVVGDGQGRRGPAVSAAQ